MNKKFLAIFALLIVAASMCAVAATSGDTIKLDGVKFKIPKGFKEDPTYEIENMEMTQNGMTYRMCEKLYTKGNDEIISLLVGDYGDVEITDDILSASGGHEKTIKGVHGYIDEVNGMYAFKYVKNDKMVVMSTNDKSLFDDFIVA